MHIYIDDDQDSVVIKVKTNGEANCHVGYRSCFYREVKVNNQTAKLVFTEKQKVFDPEKVYKGHPNPTKI